MEEDESAGYRHLSWENFRRNLVEPGIRALHPVPGSPSIQFSISDDAEKIGVRIVSESTSRSPAFPFAHINASFVHSQGKRWLSIECTKSEFYEPFYAMSVGLADLVQIEGLPPETALTLSAERFLELFTPIALLSDEKQVGLWCELWVMSQLIDVLGEKAVECWTGPYKEPHDFRVADLEYEVKGTRKETRTHVISSMSQLVASPERDLHLISVQLGLGGNSGADLQEAVDNVRAKLGGFPNQLAKFSRGLKQVGYKDEHATYYTERYFLRSNPESVLVDDQFPRITPELLKTGLSLSEPDRLDNVQYTVNVTGLGVEWLPAQHSAQGEGKK